MFALGPHPIDGGTASLSCPARSQPALPMPNATAVHTRSHYNAARLRSHTWDQLKLACMDLDEGRGTPQEVEAILKDLHAIELSWAFPGRETVQQLSDMLRSKEHHGLHLAVNHVVRMLS